MRAVRVVVATALLAVVPVTAAAPVGADGPVTYYVAADGDDAAAGTSPQTAWRTLARATAADLDPGDALLLEGGASFTGTLTLDATDAGTPSAPVTVGSWGTGRAVIAAGAADGVVVHRAGGVVVRDLVLRGAGAQVGSASGVLVYHDLPGDVLLEHIRVADVEASGFGAAGVSIGSWNGRSGYRDVRVDRVEAHANGRMGIGVWAQGPNVHRDVVVSRSVAYGNPGRPELTFNSGSGIVLGGVDGGRIELSTAYGNGGSGTVEHEGPVGIWTYDSRRIVIERNQSFGNRTGGRTDGAGFDLDQNVSESVVQFNVSHGNDGSGFLLAHGPGTGAVSGNVVRFNVSHGDARTNGGGIQVWGAVRDTAVVHNTVVTTGTAPAVAVYGHGGRIASGVTIANNVLASEAGGPLVVADTITTTQVRFAGNVWWAPSTDGPWRIGASRWSDLASWRSATGQERLGDAVTGVQRSPGFVGAGGPVVLADLAQPASLSQRYGLGRGGGAVGAGVHLGGLGIDRGTVDLVGAALEARSDAGAVQSADPAPVAGLVSRSGPIAVIGGEVVALPSPAGSTVTAVSRTATGGTWTADATGRVTTSGDAPFLGDLRALALNGAINGMAPTPSGRGYWMVAEDGGVFAFGDAAFHGSMGGTRLNRPITAMATTPSGGGYWLVASDGGIFAFGDAGFFGSLGSLVLNRPIVGMAPTVSGRGYWLFASDGGVFAFGDARFHGSLPGLAGFERTGAIGMVPGPSGAGYWIVTDDRRAIAFGSP